MANSAFSTGFPQAPVQCRLSLISGNPEPTTDVTAGVYLYLTPCDGNVITINGSQYQFAEQVITLLRLGLAINTNYSVWAIRTAGGVTTFDLSPAWTSGTADSTPASRTNGLLVNTASFVSIANATTVAAGAGTYLGTVRVNAGGNLASAVGQRFVSNYYNRRRLPLAFVEPGTTWAYSTAAFRQMNGNAGAKVEVVVGPYQAAMIDLTLATQASSAGATVITGIGEDSTTSAAIVGGVQAFTRTALGATAAGVTPITLRKAVPAGYHYYAPLEYTATGTPTFYGSGGGGAFQGLIGSVEG